MSYSSRFQMPGAVHGKLVGVREVVGTASGLSTRDVQGLGKVYTFGTNVSMFPTVEIDIPVEEIVPDAVKLAKTELYLTLIQVGVGTVLLGAAGLYAYHKLSRG